MPQERHTRFLFTFRKVKGICKFLEEDRITCNAKQKDFKKRIVWDLCKMHSCPAIRGLKTL